MIVAIFLDGMFSCPCLLFIYPKKSRNFFTTNSSVTYMKDDHHSYRRNFCSCEKKAWKKFRFVRDTDPWPLRYRCSALPVEPTGSRSLNWFVIIPWKDDDEVINIWKSYMWTAGWRIIWKMIISVIDVTFAVASVTVSRWCAKFHIILPFIKRTCMAVLLFKPLFYGHLFLLQRSGNSPRNVAAYRNFHCKVKKT